MLEEGRDCEDIVMQMAAVGKALDRAGFGLVAGSQKECVMSGQSEDLDSGKLEKLFLSLGQIYRHSTPLARYQQRAARPPPELSVPASRGGAACVRRREATCRFAGRPSR